MPPQKRDFSRTPVTAWGASRQTTTMTGIADLYLTNFGRNQLYRNDGDGTFTDVTSHAGVGDGKWSVSASFGDFNLDGHLDLYVANYLDYQLETAHACFLGGVSYLLWAA